MVLRGIPAVLGLAFLLALAGTAQADTYCVGTNVAPCEERSSAEAAFASARTHPGPDRVVLGTVSEAGPFADAPGEAVQVNGAGPDKTVLRAPSSGDPTLRLAEPSSSVNGVRVIGRELDGSTALELGGHAHVVTVETGAVRLLDGGTIDDSSVRVENQVAIRLDRGTGGVESTVIGLAGRAVAGLQANCSSAGDAVLRARHVTVIGSAVYGARVGCAQNGRTAALELSNSVLWGAFGVGALQCDAGPGRGRLATAWSNYVPRQDGCATADRSSQNDIQTDPGFAAPDGHLARGSLLIDAGDPAPLSRQEASEDADGAVRAVDGNDDDIPRRDIGAYEYQPPPPPLPAGNVLANPGAELGSPSGDAPAPQRWARTGGFTFVRYGGGFAGSPTARVSAALGGGKAFFAGGAGTAPVATATQTVDVTVAAPEIDAGVGLATVSALLGGYGETGDAAVVQAVFRDPSGVALGAVSAGPVTPAQRANATTLAHRAGGGRIPNLTRTIEVTLRATRVSGAYNDGYFDNVGLQLAIPGAPRIGRRPPRRRRPFSGIAVLSRVASVDSRGRARIRLGCATATLRRCKGVITLTRARRVGARPIRIGAAPVSVRRGRRATLPIDVSPKARSLVRRHRRLKARLYTAVRDGQGETRTSVVPIRLQRARSRR